MFQLEKRSRSCVLRDDFDSARNAYRKRKTLKSGVKCVRALAVLFVGGRVAAFLHNRYILYIYSIYRYSVTHCEMDLLLKKICRMRVFRGRKKCLEIYPFPAILQYARCEKSVLYHMTPDINRVSIMSQGLKPGIKPFVYLADSLDFYTERRIKWFGKNPVLFKVDVARLHALGRSVYCTTNGEYVTDYVEPECLEIQVDY